MRANAWIAGVAVVAFSLNGWGETEQTGRLTIENRVRVMYDNNVRDTEEGTETTSLRLTEELTVSGAMRLDNAFLSLRYRAELNWYDNRPEDEMDINHGADVIWNQTLSRRFSFSLTDAFRMIEQPELMREDGTLQRRDSSYIYNTVRGTLTTALTSTGRLDISGRHVLTRYDEELLAERDDYDLVAAGISLRGRVSKNTTAFLDVRAESIDYVGAGIIQPTDIFFPGAESVRQSEVPDRSADTLSAGFGVDRVFGPNLVGVFRAGVAQKEFTAANTDKRTNPYADVSLTYTLAAATRVTLGLSHQIFQSSLITFANQTRNAVDVRLAHDINARLRFTLSGSLVQSEYDRDESVDTFSATRARDGTEEAVSTGARFSYKMGREQWLEVGWSYTEMDSELRTDYRRSVVDASWRVRL